jgi:lysophospholipase L1-like esterase
VRRTALALLIAAVAAAPAGCLDATIETGVVVAFGDSYTEGTGATRAEAYPALLERHLGRTVINAGVNGETAMEAMARIERDVLRHEPVLVIVEFGVNEAYRGYPVQRAIAGLDDIVATLDAHGIQAILVGVHFWEYQENFDDGLRGLSREYGAPVVTDVLRGILSDPDLRSDAFHPNADGYAVMEGRIRPVVEGMLALQATTAAAA